MRLVAWLLVAFLARDAVADRLILTPTGTKVPYGTVRPEGLWELGHAKRVRAFVAVGLSQSFDAELLLDDWASRGTASFSFSYNYMVPVVDLAPGVSIGMVDVLDRTEFGRSVFVAVTHRIGLIGDFVGDLPAELTLGARTGRGAFVGFMLPVAPQVRILAEHDAIRATAGVELRPVPGLAVRYLFQSSQNLVGLSYSWRP